MPAPYPKTLDGWAAYIARQRLPVMHYTAEHLARMRDHEDEVDARAMADKLCGDPLMVLHTFALIARKRGNRPAADISTLDRAIVMLGVSPFLDAVKDLPTVETGAAADRGAYRGFLRVLRRAQHAQDYAIRIAAWRNDVAAEEIGLAALLHDAAEMLIWYFAPDLAERVQQMLAADSKVRSAVAQRVVLGTTVNDLQLRLAKLWHLPDLLVRLMDDRHADTPRVRNAILAVSLARHSASGWDNAALPDDFKALADLMQSSESTARNLIHKEEAAHAAA